MIQKFDIQGMFVVGSLFLILAGCGGPQNNSAAVKEKNVELVGLTKERIDLSLPLLILKGSKGFLACGYINVETCNKTKEACAIVTGVKTYEDMLAAEVKFVSENAKALGINPGMKGSEALKLLR